MTTIVDYANASAQATYNQAMVDLERDKFYNLSAYQKETLALQKAQDAWTKAYQTATLTGQLNGSPTMDYTQMIASLTGQYDGKDTIAWQSQQKQNALNEAATTGYYNGQATLARQNAENQTAMEYLNLLGSLSGPSNYFKYLKVLNGTPNGFSDLVNAAAGKYTMSDYGGANPTATTSGRSVNSLVGDVNNGGSATLAEYKKALSGGGVYRSGGNGGAYIPEGNINDGSIGNYNFETRAMPEGSLNSDAFEYNKALSGSGASYNGGNSSRSTGSNLPIPSQINNENWNAMSPSQQELLLGAYEDQGWNKDDVLALFKKSLPKYSGPASGTVSLS
jgi:hypothetical protein